MRLLDEKTCFCCKQILPLSLFHKRKEEKDGLAYYCKSCVSKKNKEKYEKKPAFYISNQIKYTQKYIEKIKEYQKKYREENQYIRNHHHAKRRAKTKEATPLWANQKYMKLFYSLAKEEEKRLGIKLHVDHIVPLHGRNVCGLHNEFNLQILPATINLQKRNKWN